MRTTAKNMLCRKAVSKHTLETAGLIVEAVR